MPITSYGKLTYSDRELRSMPYYSVPEHQYWRYQYLKEVNADCPHGRPADMKAIGKWPAWSSKCEDCFFDMTGQHTYLVEDESKKITEIKEQPERLRKLKMKEQFA